MLNGSNQFAAGSLHGPHFGIGIEYGHPRGLEHGRYGRFSHAD